MKIPVRGILEFNTSLIFLVKQNYAPNNQGNFENDEQYGYLA
jgi:hypothetical protein